MNNDIDRIESLRQRTSSSSSSRAPQHEQLQQTEEDDIISPSSYYETDQQQRVEEGDSTGYRGSLDTNAAAEEDYHLVQVPPVGADDPQRLVSYAASNESQGRNSNTSNYPAAAYEPPQSVPSTSSASFANTAAETLSTNMTANTTVPVANHRRQRASEPLTTTATKKTNDSAGYASVSGPEATTTAPAPSNDSYNDPSASPGKGSGGGRLWKAAGQLVQQQLHSRANTGRGPGIAETFLERTRSRADPNALYAPLTASPGGTAVTSAALDAVDSDKAPTFLDSYPISQQDEALLSDETGLVAKKRVRVVQLLIIGLVGLLLGWLGNFFTGTACNFASVKIEAGQSGQTFALHFGLWKYSPPDSAFAGYSYCYPYSEGERYAEDAPAFPRFANLAALLAGSFSLVVLWIYLISGLVARKFWNRAVQAAVLAGMLQMSTLSFFGGQLCRDNACSLGPASMLAVITACAWFGLAWELHYNLPLDTCNKEGGFGMELANLELADLQGASQEYYERFSPRGGRSGSHRQHQQYHPPTLA